MRMTNAASLAVPLVVDAGVGVNWDEAHWDPRLTHCGEKKYCGDDGGWKYCGNDGG
jgi:hypothetical protein